MKRPPVDPLSYAIDEWARTIRLCVLVLTYGVAMGLAELIRHV
jgi:hypothetical protein